MNTVAELLRETVDEFEKEITDHVETEDGYFAATLGPEIDEIRELLQEGKNDEAKRHFLEAKAKVRMAEASYKAESTAWYLLWVELGYLAVILVLGYLVHKLPDFWLWSGLISLSAKTAWFGTLGGVAVALYGIYGHVQVRNFDAKYKLWYICKPVMGAIFGWFVYLVYYVGLVSVQGASNVDVRTPAVPYAIAFLAGFSERFTVQIIDKLMQVLVTSQETTAGPRNY